MEINEKIKDYLKLVTIKDLKSAIKSDKEYIYFDVSVFNVGASVSIVCTNKTNHFNDNNWNGYDMIIENDQDLKDYMSSIVTKLEIARKYC